MANQENGVRGEEVSHEERKKSKDAKRGELRISLVFSDGGDF